MKHLRRGNALIFNHIKFNIMPERKGTELDSKRIQISLTKLGFTTFTYKDLDREKLLGTLSKASKDNYTSHDCLIIVVMTHGDTEILWAKDKQYKVNELWNHFTADNCESLIGKPKLIFIQTWRGIELLPENKNLFFDSVDSGYKDVVYTIPAMADLLVMYSIFECMFVFICF